MDFIPGTVSQNKPFLSNATFLKVLDFRKKKKEKKKQLTPQVSP